MFQHKIWKIFSISLSLSIATQAFAEDNTKHLNKGEQAPSEGFLFTVDAAKGLRNDEIELEHLKIQNNLITEENTEWSKRLDAYKEDNKQLLDRLQKTDSTFEKTLYFLGGAFVTGIIGYGVYHTRK